MDTSILSELRNTYGDRMQENVPLSGYTSARIGGPADVLIFVRSGEELAQAARKLWEMDVPFLLLGRRIKCAGERQGSARRGDHQPGPPGEIQFTDETAQPCRPNPARR